MTRRRRVGSMGRMGTGIFPFRTCRWAFSVSAGGTARIGVAIGNSILDLRSAQQAGLVEHLPTTALSSDSLNELFSLASGKRLQLRHRLFELLSRREMAPAVRQHLHAADQCELHLPMRVGDYTDFYAGIHHALNIGRQLRPDNPLLPNYKHVPIAYHGRASSRRGVRRGGATAEWSAQEPRGRYSRLRAFASTRL